MSLDLTYVVPGVHLEQLHSELLAASLVPEAIRFAVVTVPDPSPPAAPALPTNTYEDTVYLTMPGGTVEADVDAVVAAHIPKVRYDLATRLVSQAALREASRLRADYRRLEREGRAVVDLADVRLWLSHIIAVLERRDRANGLY